MLRFGGLRVYIWMAAGFAWGFVWAAVYLTKYVSLIYHSGIGLWLFSPDIPPDVRCRILNAF